MLIYNVVFNDGKREFVFSDCKESVERFKSDEHVKDIRIADKFGSELIDLGSILKG